MTYNFHTHTARCGHASGTEKEYIETAIAGGIRTMGFSDHIPLAYGDGHEDTWRIPLSQAKDYVDTLHTLTREYADRIELHIGFECEYYPAYFDSMLAYAKDLGAEYLILGQHYLMGDTPADAIKMCQNTTDPALLRRYVSTVIEGMETKKFTYVAHPDVLMASVDETVYDAEMQRLCEASRALDVPLEINFLGIRRGRHYPHDRLWRIAGQVGAPVTFGFDAHKPSEAYDASSLAVAKDMVAQHGLNYIGKPTLKPLV